MMDFRSRPGFVNDLLNTIADYRMVEAKEALKYVRGAPILGMIGECSMGCKWGSLYYTNSFILY